MSKGLILTETTEFQLFKFCLTLKTKTPMMVNIIYMQNILWCAVTISCIFLCISDYAEMCGNIVNCFLKFVQFEIQFLIVFRVFRI